MTKTILALLIGFILGATSWVFHTLYFTVIAVLVVVILTHHQFIINIGR